MQINNLKIKMICKKLSTFFLGLVIILISLTPAFTQENINEQPTENWLKEYNIHSDQFLYHRYDLYSKEDIAKFREKLESLITSKTKDEWEGIYSVGYEETVGFSQFRWNSDIGFINFHLYTCLPELRHIGYGKVVNAPDFIQLIPEFVNNSRRKPVASRYIKVKWGENRYLVEEDSLLAFSEKAVGIFVEPKDPSNENYQKWANFWVMGDFDKSLIGLPEFPGNYKRFQRLPIEAKIIMLGKRVIEQEKVIGNTYYNGETAFYTVTIDAGQNEGVKLGMKFDIPKIEDELFITEVYPTTATGLVIRSIDDDKNDLCFDEISNRKLCPEIRTSLKVKTQIRKFWF